YPTAAAAIEALRRSSGFPVDGAADLARLVAAVVLPVGAVVASMPSVAGGASVAGSAPTGFGTPPPSPGIASTLVVQQAAPGVSFAGTGGSASAGGYGAGTTPPPISNVSSGSPVAPVPTVAGAARPFVRYAAAGGI